MVEKTDMSLRAISVRFFAAAVVFCDFARTRACVGFFVSSSKQFLIVECSRRPYVDAVMEVEVMKVRIRSDG